MTIFSYLFILGIGFMTGILIERRRTRSLLHLVYTRGIEAGKMQGLDVYRTPAPLPPRSVREEFVDKLAQAALSTSDFLIKRK